MRTALCETLRGHGYRVLTAHDGPSGLEMALEQAPALILLDVMMPGLDGYAVCRELRQRGRRTPVLMLTAKGLVDDRVDGLDAGADDYLVKPFSMKELLARVRALLRRHERAQAPVPRWSLGSVVIDFERAVATRQGQPLALGAKEFAILRLLAEVPGQPVSRERFLDEVWEYTAYPSTRTVDNYIASLRAKLQGEEGGSEIIETVRGVGYRLGVDSA
jgi:DNA-binding response OmpR family regulator